MSTNNNTTNNTTNNTNTLNNNTTNNAKTITPQIINAHAYGSTYTQFSKCGKYLISAGDDQHLNLFTIGRDGSLDGGSKKSMDLGFGVTALGVINDGIVIGNDEHTCSLFDYDLNLVKILCRSGLAIRSLAYCDYTGYLAICSDDLTMKFINPKTEVSFQLNTPTIMKSIRFTNTGQYLIGIGQNGTLYLYQVLYDKQEVVLSKEVRGICKKLGNDDIFQIDIGTTLTSTTTINTREGSTESGEKEYGEMEILAIPSYKEIKLYLLPTLTLFKTLKYNGVTMDLRICSISGNGKYILCSGNDNMIYLWDILNSEVMGEYRFDSEICSIRWAALGGSSGRVGGLEGSVSGGSGGKNGMFCGGGGNGEVLFCSGIFTNDEWGSADSQSVTKSVSRAVTKGSKTVSSKGSKTVSKKDNLFEEEAENESITGGIDDQSLPSDMNDDLEMDDLEMNDDLDDFIVRDENDPYDINSQPDLLDSRRNDKKYQILKEKEERHISSLIDNYFSKLGQVRTFQPNSTSYKHNTTNIGGSSNGGGRRYLCLNELGAVICTNQGAYQQIDITFHSKERRGIGFKDFFGFSLCSMTEGGCIFATSSSTSSTTKTKGEVGISSKEVGIGSSKSEGNDKGSVLYYKPIDGWIQDWTYYLSEPIQLVSISKQFVYCVCQSGVVRVFTLSGVEVFVFCIGGVGMAVCCCCVGGIFCIVTCSSTGSGLGAGLGGGGGGLKYDILDVRKRKTLTSGVLPLTPKSELLWIGFTPNHILYTYDTLGILRAFLLESGVWIPVLDTREMSRGRTDFYWPITVDQNILRVVICKGGEREPGFPMPIFSELELGVPVLSLHEGNTGSSSGTGSGGSSKQLDGKILLEQMFYDHLLSTKHTTYTSNTNSSNKEDTEQLVLQKNVQLDKLLLQMYLTELRHEKYGKAMDRIIGMRMEKTLELAFGLARKYGQSSIAEKIEGILKGRETQEVEGSEGEEEGEVTRKSVVKGVKTEKEKRVKQPIQQQLQQQQQQDVKMTPIKYTPTPGSTNGVFSSPATGTGTGVISAELPSEKKPQNPFRKSMSRSSPSVSFSVNGSVDGFGNVFTQVGQMSNGGQTHVLGEREKEGLGKSKEVGEKRKVMKQGSLLQFPMKKVRQTANDVPQEVEVEERENIEPMTMATTATTTTTINVEMGMTEGTQMSQMSDVTEM